MFTSKFTLTPALYISFSQVIYCILLTVRTGIRLPRLSLGDNSGVMVLLQAAPNVVIVLWVLMAVTAVVSVTHIFVLVLARRFFKFNSVLLSMFLLHWGFFTSWFAQLLLEESRELRSEGGGGIQGVTQWLAGAFGVSGFGAAQEQGGSLVQSTNMAVAGLLDLS